MPDPTDTLEHDLAHDATGDGVDTGEHLFEPDAYQDPLLRIETAEGRKIDRIHLKIAGTIVLDRSLPDDCELYRSLVQGHRRDFEIETTVADETHKAKLTEDGWIDEITGVKTLKVTGLTLKAID